MNIIHSSELGWKAGQDISAELLAISKQLKAGDTFVFDEMYDISNSSITFANGVTLAGGKPGAGIDITSVISGSTPTLRVSDDSKLVDLTVTNSVPLDGHGKGISVTTSGDDISVLNCSFSGNAAIHVQASGHRILIKDTVYDGGYYQMRFAGDVQDIVIDNSLFQNSRGDGIKTMQLKGFGTQNATIKDSVFINNARDGLDTTGGFKDSVVDGSFFVGNGVSGIDIKRGFSDSHPYSDNALNHNILVKDSEFIDLNSGIVVTTLQGDGNVINASNAEQYANQNIHVENSTFENTTDKAKKAFLIKDSHHITWDNVSLLGKVHEVREEDYLNLGLSHDNGGTNVTTGSSRNTIDDATYRDMAGPDWSDISYPTNGTPTPPSPEPITYSPPPAPDLVVEPDPTPDPDPVFFEPSTDSANFPSKLLDIYLTFADTDENVLQFGDETSINSALTEGRPLTIYASSQDGAPAIGSVHLDVAGVMSRMENAEPFALFGDDGKGDFKGNKKWKDGTYSVTLTAFEGKNGSGKKLEEVTFDFTIDAQAPTPTDIVISDPIPEPVVVAPEPETDLAPDVATSDPNSQLINLSLIDTSSDKTLTDIRQGSKLSSDDLQGRKLSIYAESIDQNSSDIGSMKLELDGLYTRIENSEPFALFGDYKGNFFGGKKLEDGTHFATLTAYSGKYGLGSVLEEITIQFEIGDYDSVMIDGSTSAVSSYSAAQDKGTAKVSSSQMSVELEGSAWKSLDHFTEITELTVMKVEFKSDAEGEIHGIGFSNGQNNLGSKFFQLDGSQDLGIQDFNDNYETGSGFDTYIIPVGQYFTGEFDELVLVSDDDAGVGASSAFEGISFFEAVA